jgi:hypothetical protein
MTYGRAGRAPTLALLLIALLWIGGCDDGGVDDDDDFESDGTIIDIDPRMCPCCGGYFIGIEDETYRFQTLPEGSGIDLTQQSFPLEVELDWDTSAVRCLGDEIDVLRIALDD